MDKKCKKTKSCTPLQPVSQWHSLLSSSDMTCMETELVDTKVLVEEAEENKKTLKIVTAGLLSKYTHTKSQFTNELKGLHTTN